MRKSVWEESEQSVCQRLSMLTRRRMWSQFRMNRCKIWLWRRGAQWKNGQRRWRWIDRSIRMIMVGTQSQGRRRRRGCRRGSSRRTSSSIMFWRQRYNKSATSWERLLLLQSIFQNQLFKIWSPLVPLEERRCWTCTRMMLATWLSHCSSLLT